MPILKGSASFSRYQIEAPARAGQASQASQARTKPAKAQGKGQKPKGKETLAELAAALKLRAFAPLDRESEGERAQGFVEFANRGQSDFSPGALYQGDFAVFAYRVDEVRIPSAAIRSELEAWSQNFVAENQRPPGRKEKSDAKGEIKHTLKSRYPLASKTFEVSLNLKTGHAQLWAGSRKAVDELQAAVEQALSVKLVPIAPLTLLAGLGIAEKSLTPTPALSNAESGEVVDGEA